MAEKALTAVIQEAYIQGVSTRSVDDPSLSRFASTMTAGEKFLAWTLGRPKRRRSGRSSFANSPAAGCAPWTGTAETLDDLLARREERVLSKALTFSSAGTKYCVKTDGPGTALRGAKVALHHFIGGGKTVHYNCRRRSRTSRC
jgi:hypothetical protein